MVSELVSTARSAGRRPHPNRVAIWPVEGEGFGIDFTYHGATGYADAEAAERVLKDHGVPTKFIQELGGAWTVRFGPIPRPDARGARSLRLVSPRRPRVPGR